MFASVNEILNSVTGRFNDGGWICYEFVISHKQFVDIGDDIVELLALL